MLNLPAQLVCGQAPRARRRLKAQLPQNKDSGLIVAGYESEFAMSKRKPYLIVTKVPQHLNGSIADPDGVYLIYAHNKCDATVKAKAKGYHVRRVYKAGYRYSLWREYKELVRIFSGLNAAKAYAKARRLELLDDAGILVADLGDGRYRPMKPVARI